MNIQIFGIKKCKETQKAVRFFKERGIKIHQVDLNIKGISEGELKNIINSVPLEDLIDKSGKEYEKNNLKYVQHDIKRLLLENPLLFKTPVVRMGKVSVIGYKPDMFKEWIKTLKP